MAQSKLNIGDIVISHAPLSNGMHGVIVQDHGRKMYMIFTPNGQSFLAHESELTEYPKPADELNEGTR